MYDGTEIVERLISERELAQKRLNLLDQIIEIIQLHGLSVKNLNILESFLTECKYLSRSDSMTLGSKMNIHSDLIDRYPGYSEARTVKDKIVNILKTKRKFLHIKDIGRIMKELEFDEKKKEDYYIKNISPVLSLMAKNNDRICKVTADGNKKNTIWGLKNWLKNGEPIEDYLI